MLRGYAARQAQREEKERAAAARWDELRSHFAVRLDEAGGPVSNIVQRREFIGPEEGGWRVWWKRSELEQQVCTVQKGLERRHLTHVAFHGGRFAGAAEWQSVSLFEEAEQKGDDALIAAVFVTAARSADRHHGFSPSADARESLRFAVDQAHVQLSSQQIDTYSTARTWFLPARFELTGAPQTGEEVVGQLGDLMGEFLAIWVPVHVKVELDRRFVLAGS
jgi:hypothetical protein